MAWLVYITKCANGSYYTGHTKNLAKRLACHVSGKGAQHTRRFKPSEMIYFEPFQTESASIQRENQIKGWSRAKKEALIKHDIASLKRLSHGIKSIRMH
ncbi:MAG: GIY-YIG nuclease family protein [Kiritimatiellia bacterium]